MNKPTTVLFIFEHIHQCDMLNCNMSGRLSFPIRRGTRYSRECMPRTRMCSYRSMRCERCDREARHHHINISYNNMCCAQSFFLNIHISISKMPSGLVIGPETTARHERMGTNVRLQSSE